MVDVSFVVLGAALALTLLTVAGLVYTYVRQTRTEEQHAATASTTAKLTGTAATISSRVSANGEAEAALVAKVSEAKATLKTNVLAKLEAAAGAADTALAEATGFATSLSSGIDTELSQVEGRYADVQSAVASLGETLKQFDKARKQLVDVFDALPSKAPTAKAPAWATSALTELNQVKAGADAMRDDMATLWKGLADALQSKQKVHDARAEHANWKEAWAGLAARVVALTGDDADAFASRVAQVTDALNAIDVTALQARARAYKSIDATQVCLDDVCIPISKLLG
jgi:hypothetical protein